MKHLSLFLKVLYTISLFGTWLMLHLAEVTLTPFILCLSVLLVTIVAIEIIRKKKIKHFRDLAQSVILDLKKQNNYIEVLFSNCEIKSNRITDEEGRNTGKMGNVVVFKKEDELFNSHLIEMDTNTLSVALKLEEKTKIYIDRKNKNMYYFNLEFLN